MKTIIKLLLTVVLACSCQGDDEEQLPAGSINLPGCAVRDTLSIYEALAGRELIIDSRVMSLPVAIHLIITNRTSAVEATQILEEVLLEQACVIITPLNDTQSSVTYNDELKRLKMREAAMRDYRVLEMNQDLDAEIKMDSNISPRSIVKPESVTVMTNSAGQKPVSATDPSE